MKKHKQTKKFAKTLLNSAGIDAMPKTIGELSALNTLMDGSKELYSALTGPQFTDNEKHAVIRQLGGRLNIKEDTIKFISYLSDMKAMTALKDVIDTAIGIYLEKKRMAKATVFTTQDIGRQYEERLRASLKGLIDKDVEIEYVVDPALLGGMLVKVGSTMYDGSIKGQLRLLTETLRAG